MTETNEYRLSLLKNRIFSNAYQPWDHSFLLIGYDEQLCIILDGEYGQPLYSPYHCTTDDDVESYRVRCNQLINTLLLELPARQLKYSSEDTRLDLLIIVTKRESIANLVTVLCSEDNRSSSHLFLNLLDDDADTREMTLGDTKVISFHEMINETVQPLEVIQETSKVWGVNTETGESGFWVSGSVGMTGQSSTSSRFHEIQEDIEELLKLTDSHYYDYYYSMEDLLDEVILDWGEKKHPRTFPRTTEYEIAKLPIRAGPGRETEKILNTCMTGL